MKKHLKRIIPTAVLLLLLLVILLYLGTYYHADETAAGALLSDGTVSVTENGAGWFFDGPSDERILVFYPGGKVEESAYAPLMRRLAGEGMDVWLLKLPFRLAVFDVDKADRVIDLGSYAYRYVGGHSLGGAMAAVYASEHGDKLDGVILLAAFPTRPLDADLPLLVIYGSEDGVLNREKVAEGRKYAQGRYAEVVIEGGNHAQFGNYGKQRGDGEASVSREEQQERTAEIIAENLP